ncbi:MAG: N-acetylmuramoyl-L-alanine amidase [Verrucomicrobiales bacterium]|nr:N-acetylmuramoyl-L-alanine amidase [Verrucomicrobiales bacterium]
MKSRPLIVSLVFTALIILGLFILKRQTSKVTKVPAPAETISPPVVPIKHPPRDFIPEWSALDAYQNTITATRFQEMIETVYTVGDTWKEVIAISTEEATIQTEDGDFILKFLPEGAEPPASVERYWGEGPLAGLHIAIDPGHIGGKFAEVEERQFGFPEDKPVREGEMTLQTAKRLKPLLEEMGAKVSLVRSKNAPVTKLRTKDFLQMYREANPGVPDGLLMPWATRRFYRRAEIVERARIVNEELKPDLVLCLHYNASSDSGAWADPAKPILVDENHYHMLMNGAYTSGEVLDEGDRFQMVERILQRIHEREAALAKVVASVFVEHTGLPPYMYDPNSSRAKNVDGDPYLWARNLLANRSYTCPVLYFEPWVMNNKEVYARIQAGDYDGVKEVAGKERPSIMQEYATAVAAGIEKFYSSVEAE